MTVTGGPRHALTRGRDVPFAVDLAPFGDRPAIATADGVLSYAELDALVTARRATLGPRRVHALRPEPTTGFVVDHLARLAAGHPVLLTRDPALAATYDDPTAAGPPLHDDLRLLLSTSGSTGSPKLVRLSATNLASNAAAIADYLQLTADDRAITTLPLDYCYGLSVLHSHLLVGASVVLTDRSVTDPALWELARAHGVTSFAGVPYTFDLLESAGWPELPSLRYVTQAGGRMAPERVRSVAGRAEREGWDLVVMYGQTEATARMTWLPPHLAIERPESIGVPVPGGSVRLEPVDGAAPDVGELVFRGPNVMMGYAHSPADLARGHDLDELRTGDLARIGPDGLIEIVGRSSRFAKVFGQRVDLDRLEALLALRGWSATAVEATAGDGLVVAVADAPDVRPAEVGVTAARLAGLPHHAVRVATPNPLPRLANGKVDLAAVARLGVGAGAADDEATLVADFRAVLGIDDVRPDDSFTALGGDSLSYVALALRLEARLDRVPADWPSRPIAELAALEGRRAARWWDRHVAHVETGIPLRAIAAVLIVGSHIGVFSLRGGAHTLLVLAGAGFARFVLSADDPGARRRRVLRSAARIAVPALLWCSLMAATTEITWQQGLLLNEVAGGLPWQRDNQFWFIETLLWLSVGLGLLLAVPRVAAVERRHPFALPLGLAVVALVPRVVVDLLTDQRSIYTATYVVAWLFLGGWAAHRASTTGERLLVSAVVLLPLVHLCDDARWELGIALGAAALIWLPTMPWPRRLVPALGLLASSSLVIYLTHWAVFPHIEDTSPTAALVASVAAGVAAWWLVARGPALLRRHLPPRAAGLASSPHRKEIR